jgi:hypothetical protein
MYGPEEGAAVWLPEVGVGEKLFRSTVVYLSSSSSSG